PLQLLMPVQQSFDDRMRPGTPDLGSVAPRCDRSLAMRIPREPVMAAGAGSRVVVLGLQARRLEERRQRLGGEGRGDGGARPGLPSRCFLKLGRVALDV